MKSIKRTVLILFTFIVSMSAFSEPDDRRMRRGFSKKWDSSRGFKGQTSFRNFDFQKRRGDDGDRRFRRDFGSRKFGRDFGGSKFRRERFGLRHGRGRDWYRGFKSRLFSRGYYWPRATIFSTFFSTLIPQLPSFGVPQDLIAEIQQLQAMLLQNQGGPLEFSLRQRLAEVIDRLLQIAPDIDVQSLFQGGL